MTLADLAARGVDPPAVLALLSSSLGLSGPGERVIPGDLLPRFDPQQLPREPWVVRPAELLPG